MNYKTQVIRLGATMLLLMGIALTSIGLIFQPVKVHVVTQGEERTFAPAAMTANGMALRAEAWKEYPTYNIGLGVIAIVAFIGAINMGHMMLYVKDNYETPD